MELRPTMMGLRRLRVLIEPRRCSCQLVRGNDKSSKYCRLVYAGFPGYYKSILNDRGLRLFSTSPLRDLLRSNLNEDIFNYIVTLIAGLEYLSGSDLIRDTRRSMFEMLQRTLYVRFIHLFFRSCRGCPSLARQ